MKKEKLYKSMVRINKTLSMDKHGNKTVYSDFCVPWVHLTVICSRHGCTVKMIITVVSVQMLQIAGRINKCCPKIMAF